VSEPALLSFGLFRELEQANAARRGTSLARWANGQARRRGVPWGCFTAGVQGPCIFGGVGGGGALTQLGTWDQQPQL
jgi:hypothetical protein